MKMIQKKKNEDDPAGSQEGFPEKDLADLEG